MGTQDFKSLAYRTHHVRMAKIEAHPDVIKMRVADHFDQAVRHGKFVGNVFQQNAYTERLSEGTQVLDRSHRGLKFLLAEALIRSAQMLHQKAERNLLGDFERALDLVHGLDPGRAVD